ncbi:uncharacterized protein LOC131885676 [Tigriopus californicus]|uniref:uncharacterized protein LOC131885676 n=1 Tax=Tigriopus californicus TaxID=6832 RepID=UPI0027DA762C|nr:uncharacterized protein LOC131885676 [Tigriopus californicus]
MAIFLIDGSMSERHNQNSTRQKRLFSIFNIVTFKNEACTTTGAGNLVGTCLTSTECTAKGGSPSGNCAAGDYRYNTYIWNTVELINFFPFLRLWSVLSFSVGGDCSGDKTISQVRSQTSRDHF